jgi:hypothetical protein
VHVVELGFYRGDSLRTFDSNLSNATVIGPDIDPNG